MIYGKDAPLTVPSEVSFASRTLSSFVKGSQHCTVTDGTSRMLLADSSSTGARSCNPKPMLNRQLHGTPNRMLHSLGYLATTANHRSSPGVLEVFLRLTAHSYH